MTSHVDKDPAGQVDLRLVMSFTLKDTSDDKKLTEAGRLDLDLADRTLKLRYGTYTLPDLCLINSCSPIRFKSVDDATFWRDGLMAWKDHAIDYGRECHVICTFQLTPCARNIFPLCGSR